MSLSQSLFGNELAVSFHEVEEKFKTLRTQWEVVALGGEPELSRFEQKLAELVTQILPVRHDESPPRYLEKRLLIRI